MTSGPPAARWSLRGRCVDRATIATITIDGRHIVETADGYGPDQPGEVVDVAGVIAPGFIDLQINGGHGLDLVADPMSMWALGGELTDHGVTGFLPTFITAEPGVYDRAVDAIAARPDGYVGAEPLGLHFEGPMLAPERRGAHPGELLRSPDPSLYGRWTRDRGVAVVTLAPELPGALDATRALTAAGVVVSGGHSAADAEHAEAAVDAGMAMVTHVFNAMAPLGHRDPGLVGHALTCQDLTVCLIADGVHVDPVIVDLVGRAVGPERLVVVTDAVAAMGRPFGRYGLGDRTVVSGPGGVRRADGTLAGSALTMDQAVRNLTRFAGFTPAQAIGTASANPARVLGDRSRGRLEPGARADLVILDDRWRPVMTVVGGRPVTPRQVTPRPV